MVFVRIFRTFKPFYPKTSEVMYCIIVRLYLWESDLEALFYFISSLIVVLCVVINLCWWVLDREIILSVYCQDNQVIVQVHLSVTIDKLNKKQTQEMWLVDISVSFEGFYTILTVFYVVTSIYVSFRPYLSVLSFRLSRFATNVLVVAFCFSIP